MRIVWNNQSGDNGAKDKHSRKETLGQSKNTSYNDICEGNNIKKDIVDHIDNEMNNFTFFDSIKYMLNILSNNNYGLSEIEKEVKELEEIVNNKNSGLREIKEGEEAQDEALESILDITGINTQLQEINNAVLSPVYGLKEIKTQSEGILAELKSTGNLTTGPVIADVSAGSLVVKVYNSTNDSPVAVTVNVYDIAANSQPRSLFASYTFSLNAKCADDFIFTAPPTNYEVEFVGIKSGIFGWTATRTQNTTPDVRNSNFIFANTFNHSNLIQVVDV